MVGAIIVRRRRYDGDGTLLGHHFLDDLLNHFRDVGDRMVLEADIECLAMDLLVRRGQH